MGNITTIVLTIHLRVIYLLLLFCSQIDDRRWILKGIDSALFTLKIYYTDTNEFVNLDPTCTYMSISELDQDSGGYEGVVPGDNCSKVYIAKDAYIKTGTLKSTDGTYLNAYYSTVVVSDLRNKGMAEYDIDRRTGITMLFGGNSIKVRIIDTVGNIWYEPWFSPLFIEQPNPPTKNYVITK